jgi:hypothetical protein
MSTQTQVPTPAEQTGGSRHTSWLLVVIVGIVAAAVGLGAGYLLFNPATADVDDEVEALVDNYIAAIDAGDADAALALMEEDAWFFGRDVSSVSAELFARSFESFPFSGNVTMVGEPMVVGEFGRYDIALTVAAENRENEALWVISIWDRFGEGLKIGGIDDTARN